MSLFTDYEVDFINYFDKLIACGAKFNNNAYLYPVPVKVPKSGFLWLSKWLFMIYYDIKLQLCDGIKNTL